MYADQYTFENKVITISDSEMELHFQEVFDPVLIPEKRLPHDRLKDGHILLSFGPQDHPEETWVAQKDGVWNGEYLLLYPNGSVKLNSYYLQGKLHGPSRFFSEEGRLLSYCWHIKGLRQGKCWLYYPSGVLYAIQRYFDGLLHGKQEYFYADGNPKSVLNYVYGHLQEPVSLFPPA